ncbi:MAG TPA: inositol monophosphatase family protein [Acidimicrobiales bacterium]|nr:inositol monophosphatase family protein [Acidimicrobiales bacterium]
MDDLDSLLDLASRLARDAGALLLEGRASARVDDDNVATKTSPTDLVSDMDRASEKLLVEGLAQARPDDAILAEEGASREGSSGVRWVIDPLDGTINYLYGYPAWGVSIAAEVDGEGVVGVVYDPTRDELFSGVAGRGARCNDQTVRPSDATDLSQSLVATGFSYRPERRARQARMLATVLPAVRDIRRMGAATLDLCWVACGRVDAYYESGLQPWDLAAGAVIAAAAGARVEGLEGPVPQSGSVVAATPALVDPLRALLDEARASSPSELGDENG